MRLGPLSFALLPALLAGSLTVSHAAADSETPALAEPAAVRVGTLSGRVVSPEGEPLPGAVVRIPAAGLSSVTDVNGRFTFPRVPDGTHQVTVTYIGYQEVSESVTISAGQRSNLTLRLTPEAIALEGITVIGEMAQGQAKALTIQKNAANIVSVVSEEQIQRSPDNHAIDAVARLPGVAVAREEGEAEEVQIRGVSPQYNSVTVNGQRVATPSGGRQPRIDMLQADLIKQIAVTKALTPEQDADALGGSIDFKLAEAPHRPLFQFGLEGGKNFFPNYTQEFGEYNYSGRVSLGRRFGERQQLGVLVSASAQDRQHGYMNNHYIMASHDASSPLFKTIGWTRSTDHDWKRNRYGAVANVDYEFSADSRVHLMGNVSTFDRNQITRYNWRRRNFASAEQVARHYEVIETGLTQLDQRFAMAELGGEHRLGGMLLDYGASYSRAVRREEESGFDFRRDNPRLAELEDWTEVPHDDMFAISTPYLLDEIEESGERSVEEIRSVLANLRLPFRFLGEQSSVKVGAKVSWRDLENEGREWERELADGASITLPGAGTFSPYDRLNWKHSSNYEELVAGTVREEDLESALENAYEVSERIDAAYAQAELNFTPNLMALFGARVEQTTAEGFHQSTGSAEDSYTDILPSAHLLYRFNPNTQLRLAYSTGIARPDFDELMPYEFIDIDDEGGGVTVNQGNPALKTAHAQSFDLLFETYSSGLGLLSGGIFYKKIEDQLMAGGHVEERTNPETGLPETWRFRYRINGEQAEVWGSEFALSRRLDFLPDNLAFLRPFGIGANYTRMWSKATFGDPGFERTLPMLQTPPYAGNLILMYDNPRYGIEWTLSWNHRGPTVERIEDSRNRYRDVSNAGENYVDFTAAKALRSGLELYLEVDNVTDEGENTYWGWALEPWARVRGRDHNGRQVNFGFRYRR
jgi:TonB-dependent receptor